VRTSTCSISKKSTDAKTQWQIGLHLLANAELNVEMASSTVDSATQALKNAELDVGTVSETEVLGNVPVVAQCQTGLQEAETALATAKRAASGAKETAQTSGDKASETETATEKALMEIKRSKRDLEDTKEAEHNAKEKPDVANERAKSLLHQHRAAEDKAIEAQEKYKKLIEWGPLIDQRVTTAKDVLTKALEFNQRFDKLRKAFDENPEWHTQQPTNVTDEEERLKMQFLELKKVLPFMENHNAMEISDAYAALHTTVLPWSSSGV